MIQEKIGGKTFHIIKNGTEGSVIFCGISSENASTEQMEALLQERAAGKSFTLIVYEVDSWNRDFSPWEAPAVFGTEKFSGKAQTTLDWILQQGIPYAEQNFKKSSIYLLAGYSLAGLFSLWALYRSSQFQGCICCSGSLWFPGWEAFVTENHIQTKNSIYLSLGKKEEFTKNQVMAAVGDMTRKQSELLSKDKNVEKCTLIWNEGGHFKDPQKRLADGIIWILENL